jgi:hypothetical protein
MAYHDPREISRDENQDQPKAQTPAPDTEVKNVPVKEPQQKFTDWASI